MGKEDKPERSQAKPAPIAAAPPGTGPRDKDRPSRLLEDHLAWLTKESAQWTPEELAVEVEKTIEMMVDFQVMKAPKAVQAELRGVMREMMENDPTVSELVRRMRVATR